MQNVNPEPRKALRPPKEHLHKPKHNKQHSDQQKINRGHQLRGVKFAPPLLIQVVKRGTLSAHLGIDRPESAVQTVLNLAPVKSDVKNSVVGVHLAFQLHFDVKKGPGFVELPENVFCIVLVQIFRFWSRFHPKKCFIVFFVQLNPFFKLQMVGCPQLIRLCLICATYQMGIKQVKSSGFGNKEMLYFNEFVP